ncbi:MAG TPA: hypothetical protein VF656_19465 [Pyrinomonadaceae bacterium]|jgi:hypothetical protein
MKRILTSTLLLTLTIALISADATVGTSHTNAAGCQSQRRVKIKAVVSPRAPVGIDSAAATISDNQLVLQYALDNRADRQPSPVELLAFTLDESGRVKGGEGWMTGNTTTENQTESLLRILKTKPEDENQLLLTVWRVGAFEVSETELKNILRSHAARTELSLKGRLVKAALMEGEYCTDRLAIAKTSCSCGVRSFSCNPSNGEWSFTCYTKAESPAQCIQGEGESE